MAKRKTLTKLSDLTPDMANANKGTERGRYMVEASLTETGAGRSIVADKDGRIIAGNKTLEAWAGMGGAVKIVETDGQELVVVQRTDLDLSDPKGKARKLAYYDNRAGQVGLEWDAEQLLADVNAGVDLAAMFKGAEIAEILGKANDVNQLWEGMPEFVQEEKMGVQQITVHFDTREDVDNFAALIGQKITDKTRSIWHPYKAPVPFRDKRAADAP